MKAWKELLAFYWNCVEKRSPDSGRLGSESALNELECFLILMSLHLWQVYSVTWPEGKATGNACQPQAWGWGSLHQLSPRSVVFLHYPASVRLTEISRHLTFEMLPRESYTWAKCSLCWRPPKWAGPFSIPLCFYRFSIFRKAYK